MGTSRKTSKAVSVLMPILIGALIIGMLPTTAEGEVIGSVPVESCVLNEQGLNCDDKLKVTVAVSYGLSSIFDGIRVVPQDPPDPDGPQALEETINFTTTKTVPIVTYPLKHFHTVPYFPSEEVIKVLNTLPGTQACIDSLDAPNPSCGWTYQGSYKVPYSNGICNNKSLVELIRGDESGLWRGEEIIGEQSTLQPSFSTAHCMRLGELYYHGYEIGEPIIDYEITIEIYIDGGTHTRYLRPSSPVNDYRHEYPDGRTFSMQAQLLGHLPARQHVPQLGNYILYIPSSPDTHPYVQNYQNNMLLVPREEASKDGIDLNKVGISFQTFRQQAAAGASTEAGDGLHNQLFHKHNSDLQVLINNPDLNTEYLVHGNRIFKGAMEFKPGMAKTLKYNISEINHSLVAFTLDPLHVKEVESESIGIIKEAKVKDYVSMSNEGNMVVEISNYGDLKTDNIVTVTDCNMNIVKAIPAQVRTLEPAEIAHLRFDIYTQNNLDTTNQCVVTLKSPTGREYDEVYVLFDTEKHQSKYSWDLQQKNEASTGGD